MAAKFCPGAALTLRPSNGSRFQPGRTRNAEAEDDILSTCIARDREDRCIYETWLQGVESVLPHDLGDLGEIISTDTSTCARGHNRLLSTADSRAGMSRSCAAVHLVARGYREIFRQVQGSSYNGLEILEEQILNTTTVLELHPRSYLQRKGHAITERPCSGTINRS